MRAVPSRTTRAARVPFSGWLALGSAGLALLAPTPYILEGPGPAVDLLGEREGRPVLRVEGGEADPGEGTLDMTTVMVGGPPISTTSLLDLGRGLTDPAVDVAPRELMYPTGVTSDEGDGDEWPAIRQQVLDADLLVLGTPIWMGQPSSVAKRVLERFDAFLSETDDAGRMPSYGKVAVVAVVGNEDGAHHVSAEVFQALVDVGFVLR